MKTYLFLLCSLIMGVSMLNAQSQVYVYQDCGLDVSELILSATELMMSSDDEAKKITVRTNTGTAVAFEWSTDDANAAIITLSAKGSTATITPVGPGTATVTVNMKGNPTLTAECVVTVIDKIQTLSFSRLCFWYDNPPTNIDSTKVYDYATLQAGNSITGKKDTIRCYLGDVHLRLLADGETFINDNGSFMARSENSAYTIEAVGRVPVIARNINAAFFDAAIARTTDERNKQAWANPSYYEVGSIASSSGKTWLGDGKETMYHLTPGSINEAKYVEWMGKAFTEDYPIDGGQTYEDWTSFYTSRDFAIAEIKGAYLAKWRYDNYTDTWVQDVFPVGIVSTLNFMVANNTNTNEMGYMYTYVIKSANIVIKPFGGLDNYGLDMTLDKITGKFMLNSNNFQWRSTVNSSISAAPSRNKLAPQEQEAADLQLTLRSEDCDAESVKVYTTSQNVTITAIPKENYHFAYWSDGNTDNPRTIYLNSSRSLVAHFEQDNTALEDILMIETPQKVFHDGQLYILRDGAIYNATGMRVK